MTRRKNIIILVMLFAIMFLPYKTVYASEALSEEEVQKITQEIGEIYNICPEFLQAIAFKESSYKPDAVNDGCKGLMQINDRWHKERMKKLEVTDIYEPYGNVLVAADYLAELFEEYGEADVVLMFYNGNSRAEEYSKGIGEASDYVNEILDLSVALEREHGK